MTFKQIWQTIVAFFKRPPKTEVKTGDTPIVETLPETEPIVGKEPTFFETCYLTAFKEMGTKEIPGPNNNSRILDYHAATTLKATTDEVPWCSSFACWVVEKSGKRSPKDAWARSWLNWGVELETPVKGCICVFSRGTDSGHVGFFDSADETFIFVLGGNQSDMVKISAYPKSRLLGFRGPKK